MSALACPVCDSNQVGKFFAVGGERDMYLCDHCGSGFLYPQPEAAYDQDYFQPYQTPDDGLPKFLARHIHNGRSAASDYRYVTQMKDIVRTLPELRIGEDPPRLLDVGCGTGEFLVVAREFGFEVAGTEVSDYAREVCRKKWGLDVVHPNRLADLPSDFTVLTMWHVLEHVRDPGSLLRRYAGACVVGGLLFGEVPNWSSAWSRLRKARWRFVRKDHLTYFTPDSLVALLAAAGFRVLRKRITGTVGLTPLLERLFGPSTREFIKHHPGLIPIKATYQNLLSASKLGDFCRIVALKEVEA